MKKIIVMNRKDAIKYSYQNHDQSYAIISISEFEDRFPIFNHSFQLKDVLCLKFDDVDSDNEYSLAMTDVDAIRIFNFVNKIKNDIDILIVHCLAGRSRSAGVAAGISKFIFNDDSLFFKNYTPNMLCYRKVLESFNGIINKGEY